jgi:hypothetical protein
MTPVTLGGTLLQSGVSMQQITVSNSVVTLTKPAAAAYAAIQVLANAVYLTEDGSTPSSTNGYSLSAGDWWITYEPARVKMIRQSADATANAGYYS